jgi:hypothetical protein
MVSLGRIELIPHTKRQNANPRIERTIPQAAMPRPGEPPGARTASPASRKLTMLTITPTTKIQRGEFSKIDAVMNGDHRTRDTTFLDDRA